MKIDQFIEFLTTDKPKYTYKILKVFPNSSMADLFFREEMNGVSVDLSVNYTSMTLTYKGKEVKFISVDRVDSIKELCFNEVYVHPSIKEIGLWLQKNLLY